MRVSDDDGEDKDGSATKQHKVDVKTHDDPRTVGPHPAAVAVALQAAEDEASEASIFHRPRPFAAITKDAATRCAAAVCACVIVGEDNALEVADAFAERNLGQIRRVLYADLAEKGSRGGRTKADRYGGWADCHTPDLQLLPASAFDKTYTEMRKNNITTSAQVQSQPDRPDGLGQRQLQERPLALQVRGGKSLSREKKARATRQAGPPQVTRSQGCAGVLAHIRTQSITLPGFFKNHPTTRS